MVHHYFIGLKLTFFITFWLIFSLLLTTSSAGQENFNQPTEDFGGSGGITFNLGTHFQRVGVFVAGYYYHNFFQLNAQARWYFNFKNLGPPLKGHEGQFSLGTVFSMGEYDEEQNPFISSVGNQTGRKYSIGYAYNFYLDQRETSQSTGTIGVQLNRVDIIVENDILGSLGSDRYRTSGIFLGYRIDDYRMGLNTTFWMGNADSPKVKKIRDNSFARFGYKDLSEAEYGKYSHGLLSVQLEHVFPHSQTGRLNLGLDSEHVRNYVQNKVMHDLYFWPEKWNPARNYHVPMLDSDGFPYTYQPEQEVKPTIFFFDASLNPPYFY